MKFNLKKYLRRNKDPNTDKYLDINDDDFIDDDDLVKIVEKDGRINDVRYNVETGIVMKDEDMLTIELKKNFKFDNSY